MMLCNVRKAASPVAGVFYCLLLVKSIIGSTTTAAHLKRIYDGVSCMMQQIIANDAKK